MSENQDYYTVLGVARTASGADIKSAYRKKAMQYHPDRNSGDSSAEQNFKAVNEAYEVLKDQQKRSAYDRFGHDAFRQANAGGGRGPQGGFHGGESIFENLNDIFEGMMGQQARRQHRGRDMQVDLAVSLDEAYSGTTKTIQVNRLESCSTCKGNGMGKDSKRETCQRCGGSGKQRLSQGFFTFEQTCTSCNGRGETITNPCQDCRGAGRVRARSNVKIKVPPGIDNGISLSMEGEGEAGPMGVKAGNLIVRMHLERHEIFLRDRDDLLCRHPLGMVPATLGADLKITGIDGQSLKIKVPEGSQPNSRLKLKGAGMPVLGSGGRRGDLYVELIIEVPVALSEQQKTQLKKFDKSLGEANSPRSFSFSRKAKEFWQKVTR